MILKRNQETWDSHTLPELRKKSRNLRKQEISTHTTHT